LLNLVDGVVRTELSEQLAQVGKFCQANQQLFSSGGCPQDPFKTHILAVVFRFVADINNQVCIQIYYYSVCCDDLLQSFYYIIVFIVVLFLSISY